MTEEMEVDEVAVKFGEIEMLRGDEYLVEDTPQSTAVEKMEEMVLELEEMTITLPSDYCPGSDLMSKIMLKDERLVNIILKDVVGNHASSTLYTLGRYEWANKTVSDVLYLPTISDLPPALLKIQNKVNEDFIG